MVGARKSSPLPFVYNLETSKSWQVGIERQNESPNQTDQRVMTL